MSFSKKVLLYGRIVRLAGRTTADKWMLLKAKWHVWADRN
jgi:hypothetical protein